VRRGLRLALLLTMWLWPWTVAAADSAPASSARPPLSALPEIPRLSRPAPKEAERTRLEHLLVRLVSESEAERALAQREIAEADASLISAIDQRMNALADAADRGAMKKALRGIRRKARQEVREQMRAAGKRGKVETPDYLEMLLAHAQPTSKTWRDLVSTVALSRMLMHIGTVDAVRELIDVYVRFGEFLRVDTQLQLDQLGERAVAALIEARRHPAEKIGRWAERQLDQLGMAIPNEAVRAKDPDVLADVLRAYGRAKDPDAARVVISFANSDRAQIRLAARQAVAMLAEVANWQLRDTYENIVGKKPPRDWSWRRTAQELFSEFDRLRLAQVYQLFDTGKQAQSNGDLASMLQAYNQVLARSPRFEHRQQMASGYLAFARQASPEQREEALDALIRAARISTDEPEKKQIESLRLTLEGETLLAQGVADQVLFQRAREIDPSNERARDAISLAEHEQMAKQTRFNRFAAAGVIGVVAILAILAIALRRGRREAATSPTGKAADGGGGEPAPGESGELEAVDIPGREASDEPPGEATTDTTASGAESANGPPEPEAAGEATETEARAEADGPSSLTADRTASADPDTGPLHTDEVPSDQASADDDGGESPQGG